MQLLHSGASAREIMIRRPWLVEITTVRGPAKSDVAHTQRGFIYATFGVRYNSTYTYTTETSRLAFITFSTQRRAFVIVAKAGLCRSWTAQLSRCSQDLIIRPGKFCICIQTLSLLELLSDDPPEVHLRCTTYIFLFSWLRTFHWENRPLAHFPAKPVNRFTKPVTIHLKIVYKICY